MNYGLKQKRIKMPLDPASFIAGAGIGIIVFGLIKIVIGTYTSPKTYEIEID